MTIILALLAALVGPLLVDWTAYRAAFEERAGEILGHPVQVTGTADATLLPYPELVFTGVTIGEDPANPLMTVGRFEIEVELFPLLSGEVRVTRMQLDRPDLTLRVDGDGELDWIAEGAAVPIDPARVVLDRIDITGGEIRIVDERRPAPVEITGVNATIEARSLVGPYKFDGGVVVEGEPAMVRLSTGTRDPSGRMVVKAAVTPASTPVEITVDGAITAADRRPEYAGALSVRRVVADGDPALPWSFTADVTADAGRARAAELEFRYGPEDRPFSISGAATLDLSGDPTFEAVLSARQIDLDRTLGAGPGEPVSFERAVEAIAATLAGLPRPPVPGRIGFDIPGIVVGGSLVQQVRLDVASADDGWEVETLDAGLPGRTTLAATGRLVTRPAVSFTGSASLASEQPATLLAWWHPDRPRVDLDPFDLRSRVSISASGLELAGLDARLGSATLTGEVTFAPPRSGIDARIDAAIAADTIPLDQIAAVAGLAAGEGDGTDTGSTDVVLRLSADRVPAGDTTAEGVELSASLVDDTLTVERFAVRDLAGARISAEGSVRDVATAPDGSLQGRISAERLDGLAALVADVAPGSALAGMLDTAAPVLVPASLEATVTAARVGEGTNARVEMVGTAGGSSIDLAVAFAGRVDRWREASTEISLDLSGPSGVRLMRQLGFDVPDVAGAGLGRLAARAHGVAAEGMQLSLDGSLGGTTVGLAGTVRLPDAAPATAGLDVDLVSDDVGPILALGGGLMSDLLAATPVDLSARAEVEGPRVAFTSLTGTVGGERIAGSLSLDTSPAVPAVRGDIATGRSSVESLLELAFGPGTLQMPIVASRNPWPEAPFGPTLLDGLDTDISLSFDRLENLEDLPDLTAVRTALRSSAAGIGFDGIEASFAGGRIGGSLVVKRDLEGQAAVTGQLSGDGLDAATLAWRSGDQPVLTGRLAGDLEFTASGRTVAGLVSTLNGGGTVAVDDGVIRSMNPQAFTAVVRAADAGQSLPDERIRDLFRDNVDVGDLTFDRIEGAYTITSGVLRAPNLAVAGATAETKGSATLDLSRGTIESDWTLALSDADLGGSGTAPPQVDILFRGRTGAPERRIDVTAFSSWLGIRAFERETERVLALQADILERELLSRQVLRTREAVERRLRAEEEARIRAEEEEARRAAEEAARLAGEVAPDETPGAPEDALGDDFVDQIGRRLDALIPPDEPPAPPLQPPSEIRRVPLAPPPSDTSLPGVSIPPP